MEQQGSDWNKYTREYRRRNPDKVLKWRAKAAENLLKKLEEQKAGQAEQEKEK